MITMVRLQFELTEGQLKELKAIMEKTKVRTKKNLINNALTLFEWAVQEKERGRIIASVDEASEKYKEVTMPALSAISTS
jgi:hypothetical protein